MQRILFGSSTHTHSYKQNTQPNDFGNKVVFLKTAFLFFSPFGSFYCKNWNRHTHVAYRYFKRFSTHTNTHSHSNIFSVWMKWINSNEFSSWWKIPFNEQYIKPLGRERRTYTHTKYICLEVDSWESSHFFCCSFCMWAISYAELETLIGGPNVRTSTFRTVRFTLDFRDENNKLNHNSFFQFHLSICVPLYTHTHTHISKGKSAVTVKIHIFFCCCSAVACESSVLRCFSCVCLNSRKFLSAQTLSAAQSYSSS